MAFRVPTTCIHLDRHHGCRHAARRRSRWHPLRWIGLDRPGCVFIGADLHRDGPEAVRCPHRIEPPRPEPPRGCTSELRRPGTAFVAIAVAAALGGCDAGDHITDTRDPCEFVLDFGARCTPASRTSICTRRRTVVARNTAKECNP